MIDRMIRAAKLDVDLYEEVEHDPELTTEALRVVVIVSALAGIGTALGILFAGQVGGAVIGLFIGVVQAVIAWGVWSFMTYIIGSKLFGGTATYGELLRTLGYAYTPEVLRLLVFIPFLGGLLGLLGFIWWLAAGFVAVRQALDFDNGRTIATIVIAIIPAIIIIGILSVPLALLTPSLNGPS